MSNLKWRGHVLVLALSLSALGSATTARAQQAQASPEEALTDALSAACRQDSDAFANSLTADNATAYRALPGPQRTAIMKRFVLLEITRASPAFQWRHRPRSAALRNSGDRNGNALWRNARA